MRPIEWSPTFAWSRDGAGDATVAMSDVSPEGLVIVWTRSADGVWKEGLYREAPDGGSLVLVVVGEEKRR